MTIHDALAGWHHSIILGCGSAETFFYEFMYSPDSDELEESFDEIEAACHAKFDEISSLRA